MALTFAGTAAIVLTAGSAAVAANLGILGSASNEPVGQLDASTVAELSGPTTTVAPIVVTVDEIVPVPVETPPQEAPAAVPSDDRGDDDHAPAAPAPAPVATTAPRATSTTTVKVEDDHHGEDDRHGEDDHESGDDD